MHALFWHLLDSSFPLCWPRWTRQNDLWTLTTRGASDKTQIWKQLCALSQGWLIRLGETLIEFLSFKRCLNTPEASDRTNPLQAPVWHTHTKSRGHTESHFKIQNLYFHIITNAQPVPKQKKQNLHITYALIQVCESNFYVNKVLQKAKPWQSAKSNSITTYTQQLEHEVFLLILLFNLEL